MFIHEAAKMAYEKSGLMVRKGFYLEGALTIGIKPTNGYDCCIIIRVAEMREEARARCWNPTMDDLTADDWEVIALEEFGYKRSC